MLLQLNLNKVKLQAIHIQQRNSVALFLTFALLIQKNAVKQPIGIKVHESRQFDQNSQSACEIKLDFLFAKLKTHEIFFFLLIFRFRSIAGIMLIFVVQSQLRGVFFNVTVSLFRTISSLFYSCFFTQIIFCTRWFRACCISKCSSAKTRFK